MCVPRVARIRPAKSPREVDGFTGLVEVSTPHQVNVTLQATSPVIVVSSDRDHAPPGGHDPAAASQRDDQCA